MKSANDPIKRRCHEIANQVRPPSVTTIKSVVATGFEARIEYNLDGTATVEAADPDDPGALLALLHESAQRCRRSHFAYSDTRVLGGNENQTLTCQNQRHSKSLLENSAKI